MATLTYADQATLKNSVAFLDRCSIAVAKYAQYIIGESPATQFHTSRAAWAKNAITSPVSEAQRVIFFVIWDPAITGLTSPADQSVISDATLQPIVEAAINNTSLKF